MHFQLNLEAPQTCKKFNNFLDAVVFGNCTKIPHGTPSPDVSRCHAAIAPSNILIVAQKAVYCLWLSGNNQIMRLVMFNFDPVRTVAHF